MAPEFDRSLSRRGALLGLLASLVSRAAFAGGEIVPLALQVKLCGKVIEYDKNFRARARDRLKVGVLVDDRVSESRYTAMTLRRELDELGTVGNVPLSVEFIQNPAARALRAAVDLNHYGLLYVTPGFSERASAYALALLGADLITVSTMPADVPNGIVLGVDLVSSQPKLWVNLSSAQNQNVAFAPQALKLMRVYR